MVRSPSSLKVTSVLKKGPWTSEEDEILTKHIRIHGHPNWRALPRLAGLARCGKSCRLRWTNYLQPGIKRGNFSREEEETIITLHQLLGNRWSAIAAKLPGRTDNEIKNVWHTHLKKRLLNKDDVQQSSPSTTHQSSISNTNNDENDFILVDESIFDTVWDNPSINQVHHHTSNVEDPSHDQSYRNSSDTLACSKSDETSYNNYEDVPSPEAFLETDESFWSDVLSSDHHEHNNNNNSCTSSMESYYPCYDQQLVDESTLLNMETSHSQEFHVASSLLNVGSNQQVSNVNSEYITIENGGDVDDFWFDVLFRAGENILFS